MGWLQSVGSTNSQGSFAHETCKRNLQKIELFSPNFQISFAKETHTNLALLQELFCASDLQIHGAYSSLQIHMKFRNMPTKLFPRQMMQVQSAPSSFFFFLVGVLRKKEPLNIVPYIIDHHNTLLHTATLCNTLQHSATRHNTTYQHPLKRGL